MAKPRNNYQPPPIVLCTVEEGLERWNNKKRMTHGDNSPLSDNLFTLMAIVQADLTEQQREMLTSHIAIRGVPLHNYTFDLITTAFLELVCAPRSSLDNPSFRPANQQKTIQVQ